MSKEKYHVINKLTKDSILEDNYDICLYRLTNSSKSFRQTHKIISDDEYQKIIKKKSVL